MPESDRHQQPALTVRAFAELMRLPAYEQLRILAEQKHPSQQPQVFRTPFYLPALAGIRSYYRSGNDPRALEAARIKASEARLRARRDSNLRVIAQFARGEQARRVLLPVPGPRASHHLGGVELRLQFDISAREDDTSRHIFYNCRAVPIDGEVARTTLELAHWVLEETGVDAPLNSLEYVDLTGGRVYRTRSRRPRSIQIARRNAAVIETLWPSV